MSGGATGLARLPGDAIGCDDAARLLAVPTVALTTWSRIHAFPRDVGSAGAPAFPRDEIEALHAGLEGSHSVEGAIREARRRLGLTD